VVVVWTWLVNAKNGCLKWENIESEMLE
jgi:hypothetical protein